MIIVVGPTGVGKTAVAVELAGLYGTEIISADSRQCYRELSIGVARPSPAELAAVPHHFIASHSLLENLTAADFAAFALGKAAALFTKYRVVVMAGGTGLYVKAFADGLDDIPAADPAIRAGIIKQYEVEGLLWLQEQVKQADPAWFADGDIQNPQRLMRALEVYQSTGQSIRTFQRGTKAQRPFDIVKLGLDLPRPELYKRINRRVDLMMEAGLLQEVKDLVSLFALEPGKEVPNALRTVGYTEMIAHLFGNISLDEAVHLIKQNTRHYAKRQLTWFRKDPEVTWGKPFPEFTIP
ncbi:tRNA dimethylallyltransferase [Flavihumibacter petaseus NBRC 106054]|uniref:tRNA dimethylallyltransferase n=1 Tax=Flavihumibacter petaseus NBRC 106054 TaxID=1220578 RepID=A0A0E9N0D4_9BACT|nr:tRNA dimethylallyltransferase [Flavihumibacter petaseus NBRC 106054]